MATDHGLLKHSMREEVSRIDDDVEENFLTVGGERREPITIELEVKEVAVGCYSAKCPSVNISDECIHLVKLHNPDSALFEKYNIKIPYSEIKRVTTSLFPDRSKGRYMFLDVVENCADKIAAALKFDKLAYSFSRRKLFADHQPSLTFRCSRRSCDSRLWQNQRPTVAGEVQRTRQRAVQRERSAVYKDPY